MNRSEDNTTASQTPFPVVGIGASAGGLDAIKLFLQALSPDSGMAYIFIQHFSPDHTSNLPEILRRISPVPVREITDHIRLERDTLFVIPENTTVSVADGELQLSSAAKSAKKSDTIDRFFTSLGAVYQSHAIGVVLSGSLDDGTEGLKAIKTSGGITFAQDSNSAAFASMPESAVSAGAVDFVLPPEEIARQLIKMNRPFRAFVSDENEHPENQAEHDVFKQILTVMRARRGVDFQHYKSSTLKRRIIRRMALSKYDDPAEYLYHLRDNRTEQDALYTDMLISVTSFFRDPQSFSTLIHDILPEILKTRSDVKDPIRIWVAGCATGEEAYSLAMALHELLGESIADIRVQIFATDISETAIAKARAGIYRSNELDGLSKGRLHEFFTKTDGSYQINKPIRDMCIFAHHNLLKDPPFSRMDLISCRNVLIYFEPVLQKKALTTFHYALKENGFLFLGNAETVGSQSDIFSVLKSADKVYQRTGPGGRYMHVASYAREQTFKEINYGLRNDEPQKDIFRAADEALLEHFMPASVLLNEKLDVIQFKGNTEAWLALPQGKPSFNLLKIARHGLSFELSNLVQQAKKSGETARKFGVFFKIDKLQHYVNLHVVPLTQASQAYFLAVFQPASSTGIEPTMFELPDDGNETNFGEENLRIEHLERELIQSRADMRVISEEQENAIEKMQSANEELLSASEELQSLNEELETSKEELQSTNEELIIVNKELVERNEQLTQARRYAEAIIDTIREPLLILDKRLRIKRASNSFYARFDLKDNEVEGRFLYEISDELWNVLELRHLLERILPDDTVLENFELVHEQGDRPPLRFLLHAYQLENGTAEPLMLLSIKEL